MIRILINWMNPGRIFQNLNHLIFLCKMNRDTLTHHQNKTEHLTLRLAQDELSLSGFPRSQVYDGRIGLPVCIMSRPKLFSTKMRMQGGKIRDTPSDTLTIAICSEISPRSHTAPFLMSFPLPFLFLSPSFPFFPLYFPLPFIRPLFFTQVCSSIFISTKPCVAIGPPRTITFLGSKAKPMWWQQLIRILEIYC